MEYKLEVVYVGTEDELSLQGMHYAPKNKEVGVVFVHGMSGNFIENAFADVMGKTLVNNGVGYIYGHNRGYGHINDMVRGQPKPNGSNETVRNGATFESFKKCVFDIEAWVNKAEELGYKKLVIIGHSLGAIKIIYWWGQRQPKNVNGVVLMSPGDMVGLVKKPGNQPNYKELMAEAKVLVKKGKYSTILSGLIWDWYNLSAQTFIDLFTEGGPADVLPLYRKPSEFTSLAQIKVPILGILGENDDVIIRSLEEDLELMKSKATNCPSFTKEIIAGANHTYDNREEELAKTILKWIRGGV